MFKIHLLEEVSEGVIGRSFQDGNYFHIPAKVNIEQGMVGNKWT